MAPEGAGPLHTLLLLAVVGLIPLAFMALTAFVKIATVLQILKSALGTPSVPSAAIVLALSAALTLIAMAPVGTQIANRLKPVLVEAQQAPGADGAASLAQLSEIGSAVLEPLRAFFEKHAAPREKQRFLGLLQRADSQEEPEPSDLRVLIPAFLVSELFEAFSLGFAIFLPFLVVDLVVANVLMGLGMQAVSPTQISLPFKLLLFVAIDGWGLLAEALVGSYLG